MKKDKFIVVILIMMIILLIGNLIFSFSELADYNKRKTSGNARWNQVEERIVNIENEINVLKSEVKRWKQ